MIYNIIYILSHLYILAPATNDYNVVVFLNINNTDFDKDKIEFLQEQHMSYLHGLTSQNKLGVTGAFENGGEVLIFNSGTISEIKEWLKQDSAITTGLYRPEIYKANIRHGDICYSNASDFNSFNFIKFTSHITKYNVQHVPQLLKSHDDYINKILETGNVIMEAVYTNSDGGFMVIPGDLSKQVIFNDPTVAAGFIIPELKTVYVPKGTFCENN